MIDNPAVVVDAAVVNSMIALLAGDERTQFELWRTLADTDGDRYYVIRQMSEQPG